MTDKKRNTAIEATTDDGRLVLTFANGKVLVVEPSMLAAGIRDAAMLHGLKQKLVDAAAIGRNPENGRAASIEDKYEAVRAVFDRITRPDGTWNAVGGGGTAGAGGLLFRALVRLFPAKTPDDLKAYLAERTDAEQTALRKNPKIAAMIEVIRAETGKPSGIDTDALLGELDV